MIIKKHGDIVRFQCRACGCIFCEAAKNTCIDTYPVFDADLEEHGTRMDCPECGETVMGFRRGEMVEDGQLRDHEMAGTSAQSCDKKWNDGGCAATCHDSDSGKAGSERGCC